MICFGNMVTASAFPARSFPAVIFTVSQVGNPVSCLRYPALRQRGRAQEISDSAASVLFALAGDYQRCDNRVPSFIVGGTFAGAVAFQSLPR